MDLPVIKKMYSHKTNKLVCPPQGSRLIEIRDRKPTRHNIIDEIVSSYNSYLHREMELYIGCEDGLYNICNPNSRCSVKGVQWRCLAKRDDSMFEQLLRETYKQESLSDLGIGKEKSLPGDIQQYIYKQMRPETSSATTQSRQSTAEFETQTYWTGMNQKDIASQAVRDTMDNSVQAVQDTHNSGIQAVQETMESGIQAVQETLESGIQTVWETLNRSVQAKPGVADFGSQAQMCNNFTSQQNSAHGDCNRMKIYFNKSDLLVVEINGKTMTMSAMESSVILVMVKNLVKTQMSGDSKDSAVGAREFSDIQPCPDSGDSQMLQGATAAIVDTRYDSLEKAMKKSQDDKQKFHKNIPYEGHLDKYLSKTSPFSEYGYVAARDTSATLDNIKIPVVDSYDITYEKTENNSVVLGRGGFGCVYFAKHCQYTMDMCIKEYEDDSTTLYDIHHEAQTLIYLQSTNFVPQCFGIMVSPFIPTDISLVQECFAKGYTLKKLLKDRPNTFVDRKWIAIVYQLFWGLQMIHEKQVLLNDIKTDNILVNWKSDDMTNIVRFIDMGLATFRKGHRFSENPSYMMEYCETYAPEVRQGQFSTPASDLYAVGYMVNEISETIGIAELDYIAEMCTEDDPHIRPSCHCVLEKLEDILENT
ncbi:uncharacterized protein LOC117322819 [Pecten maximus]|uniref:uncharacterized protein LOC117322819 n=1 Tax=Pecten maximus TaxID=6579 RepID=UPI001458B8CA|nr:uncharacterized protein LOC117322819 [Pecten maximus]